MAKPNTYEIVRQLCDERKISVKQLEADLGLGNGTIGSWRVSSPSVGTLCKVADYFHVSIDYLAGRYEQED